MSEQIEQPMTSELPEGIPPSAPGVGVRLRTAREAAGLQVSEIAQALKLGQRQVEALETENWQGLPGHTFTRGFVRNYARMLGLDPAPLMTELDRILEKPVDTLDVPEATPAAMPVSSKPRDRMVVVFGIVLLLLAAAAYLLLPSDLMALRERAQTVLDGAASKEAPAVQAEPPAAAAPAEPAFPPGTSAQQLIAPQSLIPAAPVEPAPAAASGVAPPVAAATNPSGTAVVPPQLRFVLTQESWLEVRDRDGKQVFSQRLPAGSEQMVSGKGPLSIAVGYAPGVKLFSHGQAIDLTPHTRGDVARLILE